MKDVVITLILICAFSFDSNADERFKSDYPCSNRQKTCVSSGIREIDDYAVHRDCWEYSYEKKCDYPSKNNCDQYRHCYAAEGDKCLLKDAYGKCVNKEREFSCKSWDYSSIKTSKARMSLKEQDGKDQLVCKGIPCIDGNCADKSYETNGEMMDSISKLYTAKEMKRDKNGNVNLFQGKAEHCSKKKFGYSNCCAIDPNGWGRNLGAMCTPDENHLMESRKKNLCIDVGVREVKTAGVDFVKKFYYCCFSNILDKVIQVEGRKQLGIGFGTADSPNCRGFDMDQIQRLDFDKMDFREFIEDYKLKFAKSYKKPTQGDLKEKVKSGINSIRKFDNNRNNKQNNYTGWNANIKDDSWEAEEEARIERERLERERLEKERLERERLEKERLEKERLERERQERIRLEREQQEREKERLERERVRQEQQERERKRIALQEKQNYIRSLLDRKKGEIENHTKIYEELEREVSKNWPVGGTREEMARYQDSYLARKKPIHDLWSKLNLEYTQLQIQYQQSLRESY